MALGIKSLLEQVVKGKGGFRPSDMSWNIEQKELGKERITGMFRGQGNDAKSADEDSRVSGSGCWDEGKGVQIGGRRGEGSTQDREEHKKKNKDEKREGKGKVGA